MKNLSLTDISNPVNIELEKFNDIFKNSVKSGVGLVDIIARYILRQKGKKIRPLLVMLAAKAAGGINERTYRGAVLVELLHTATLVHDDVVDNADKRRGFWSINAVFKNKAAVLMGDYLLAKGLMISVDGKDFDFLSVMTDTVKRMSEGELLQIQKTRKLDIDEETYFKVIKDKTASLLDTCCRIGAKSATDNEAFHESMHTYGESIGIAFQIIDDILDYTGNSSLIGKPVGGDIKEKKITLPLLYAFKNSEESEAKRIRGLIKKKPEKHVDEIIEFVKKHKGIEDAFKKAEEYAQSARVALADFPESESKQALISLVDFIIYRKK